MEAFRQSRKPQISERFLTMSETGSGEMEGGDLAELDEGEMFWIETDLASTSIIHQSPPPTKSPPLLTRSHSETLHCVPLEKNHGILAVLPDDDYGMKRKTTATVQRPTLLLQRKSSLPSPSSFSSESLKMSIPRPRPKLFDIWDGDRGWRGREQKGKRTFQQSAPVNIIMCPRKNWIEEAKDDGNMLPPHEIVDLANESPMTTFSVLEGVGRTLKGRDLRRVRNAVWRQTGFID